MEENIPQRWRIKRTKTRKASIRNLDHIGNSVVDVENSARLYMFYDLWHPGTLGLCGALIPTVGHTRLLLNEACMSPYMHEP